MPLIRGLSGLVLVFGGAAAVAIGVTWTYLAIAGSEWDYCNGSECIPGYYGALIPVVAGVGLALAGAMLLRLPPN
jgi:hypothetical protein